MPRNLHPLLIFLSLALCSCLSRGCSQGTTTTDTQEPGDHRINLFIWGDYTSESIFAAFEQQTGIQIVESNFSSNEELLAKLQAGASGYDLIIPSDYMVRVMKELDLLEPLDHTKIPNLKNIDPRLLNRDYDPKNSVSIPYSWSLAGLIYNKNKVSPAITGYLDLFTRDNLRHRISLLDDSREVVGSILKSFGQSVNTTDIEKLETAKIKLINLKRSIREFTSSPVSMLRHGDLLAAQIYSNEALRLIQTNPEFEFVIPDEGFTMAIDNMAIPRASTRKANVLKLINFLLREDINLQFAQELLAAPVIINAKAKLPEFMQKQPSISQFDIIEKRGEMLLDLGPHTAKYDRLWTEVKASSI
jgi:spermidine/putrescine transport system substrate-binding protein